jgi:hypothetical protein
VKHGPIIGLHIAPRTFPRLASQKFVTTSARFELETSCIDNVLTTTCTSHQGRFVSYLYMWQLIYLNLMLRILPVDFFPIFGFYYGSGARFEAISWEEVGRRTPTQILYKPEVFDSMGRFKNNRMLKNLKA